MRIEYQRLTYVCVCEKKLTILKLSYLLDLHVNQSKVDFHSVCDNVDILYFSPLQFGNPDALQ